MKKLFTLIELIVVIVILVILTAIVVPNISSFRDEATKSAILSDSNNIQTGVDMYFSKGKRDFPTFNDPTIESPQPVDFDKLYPQYIRNMPIIEGRNHWIDVWGKVWISTIDSPKNIRIENGELHWNKEADSTGYFVYKVNKSKLPVSSLDQTAKLEKMNKEPLKELRYSLIDPSYTYLVSSVDKHGFETAPVGVGYYGYEYLVDINSNKPPIAVISIPEVDFITPKTKIIWSYEKSIVSEGNNLVNSEWKIGGTAVSTLPDYLDEGNYEISLRVQDNKGVWSEWTTKTVQVHSGVYPVHKIEGEDNSPYCSKKTDVNASNGMYLDCTASSSTILNFTGVGFDIVYKDVMGTFNIRIPQKGQSVQMKNTGEFKTYSVRDLDRNRYGIEISYAAIDYFIIYDSDTRPEIINARLLSVNSSNVQNVSSDIFKPINDNKLKIEYSLSKNSYTEVYIEDIQGNKVKTIKEETYEPSIFKNNTYSAVWDGKDQNGFVEPGDYNLVIQAKGMNKRDVQIQKTLVKVDFSTPFQRIEAEDSTYCWDKLDENASAGKYLSCGSSNSAYISFKGTGVDIVYRNRSGNYSMKVNNTSIVPISNNSGTYSIYSIRGLEDKTYTISINYADIDYIDVYK